MDNLIFSLNATVPIFLLMVLGLFFRKLNWIDEEFATKMNAFVFRVPLPVMLFADLAKVDFKSAWNGKFVLFCFIATLLSIILVALFSLLWKDKTIQGEFIQASYRSSAAILGIAFIQNIYGNAGMAPVMIIGSVPLYNIMAVVVLFWNKLWPFHMKNEKPAWKDGALSMWLKIIVAVIPAAIIGVLFDDKIDELFYHPVPVAIALIVVAISTIFSFLAGISTQSLKSQPIKQNNNAMLNSLNEEFACS